MAWRMTRDFVESKGGTEKGMCLKNVRLGYNISARYATAWKAWENTQQHRDRNFPQGVDVPVFYSFYTKSGNEGHINVRTQDGRLWSDGKWYASVEDYEAKQTPEFVGWGESVNNVRVLEWVPDPVAPPAETGTTIRMNTGKWNVRTAPNLSAPIIGGGNTPALGGQVYNGVSLDNNGWANITFTGKSGWVGPKSYTRI